MRAIDLLVGPLCLDRLVPGAQATPTGARAAGLAPW